MAVTRSPDAIRELYQPLSSPDCIRATRSESVGWVERSDTHQLGSARSDRESNQ